MSGPSGFQYLVRLYIALSADVHHELYLHISHHREYGETVLVGYHQHLAILLLLHFVSFKLQKFCYSSFRIQLCHFVSSLFY